MNIGHSHHTKLCPHLPLLISLHFLESHMAWILLCLLLSNGSLCTFFGLPKAEHREAIKGQMHRDRLLAWRSPDLQKPLPNLIEAKHCYTNWRRTRSAWEEIAHLQPTALLFFHVDPVPLLAGEILVPYSGMLSTVQPQIFRLSLPSIQEDRSKGNSEKCFSYS